ncbi:NAD(P)/FAD-dependent oxidoreductase [Amycolatopsis taiwanensis]|uniref:Pyridine nucleotide-disulfide oxidoreductase n=1 Tax=Amycolatopsis taiwanensis TaxID=342230 RepID=A0A9W6RC00_9PSEU|nr:FAD-dependent oxidoreductase [Amycolatopsis taiwanensis]GLY71262.1 pyridine nucleotide-disulfide oxidoreductase [Amycolatopsis taiwanensis]
MGSPWPRHCARGYSGRIRLIGEESYAPYDRPPLSKEILAGTWRPARAFLRDREQLDKLDTDFVLGRRAVRLDAGQQNVELDDGSAVSYSALVVATGLISRRLPFGHDLTGVHSLRTMDDALALHAGLQTARRVAVIGAGVLGCEIAATARTLGLQVTLIDAAPGVMVGQLGDELSAIMAKLHESHGVDVRIGVGVAAMAGVDGHVDGVDLIDGTRVAADLVVVATGSVPATEWLAGSGLSLGDGVECDSHCRAAPGIHAVGDVARWHHEVLGESIRLENRSNATQQANAVAADILGTGAAYTPIPYFWTDQYDVKLQIHGIIPPGAQLRTIDGELGTRRFTALAVLDGVPTAAIGWNHPRGVLAARRHLGAPQRPSPTRT